MMAQQNSTSDAKPILPGATLGVLGSGQLGRMFAMAAARMGYRVHVFSPDKESPTAHVAQFETVAAYEDSDAIAKFASVPTGRVLVNVPGIHGGAGYATDLEPSFMLGTGTWSGSITSDNVTALHLINIKRVAYANRDWRDIYEDYA